MNHDGIPIFKNLNQEKNINDKKKKKRINNLNLRDTKPDPAHLQKKNLISKNILIKQNKSGSRAMKG